MKLLEAAFVETGYVEILGEAIIVHVDGLPMPEKPKEPDNSGRDSQGRFMAEYNECYRKGTHDDIGHVSET